MRKNITTLLIVLIALSVVSIPIKAKITGWTEENIATLLDAIDPTRTGAYTLGDLDAEDIDTPAELETVANLGAFFSDLSVATDASNARSILGLGTAAVATVSATLEDDSTLPTGAAVTAAIAAIESGSGFFTGVTVSALDTTDTTPEVAAGGLYTTTLAAEHTVTDFVYSSGSPADGDHFGLIVNDDDFTIDFSTKTNIVGNAGTDYTGSSANPEFMIFVSENGVWYTDFNHGKESALSMGFASINLEEGTIQGSALVVSDDNGINLTIGTHNGSVILMTGDGEVGLWDCSATTVGSFVTVINRDVSEQVEVVMYGDTSNDLFRLFDGDETGVNDEADLATTAGAKATFMCLETNKWWVVSENGEVTDGGEAN